MVHGCFSAQRLIRLRLLGGGAKGRRRRLQPEQPVALRELLRIHHERHEHRFWELVPRRPRDLVFLERHLHVHFIRLRFSEGHLHLLHYMPCSMIRS